MTVPKYFYSSTFQVIVIEINYHVNLIINLLFTFK